MKNGSRIASTAIASLLALGALGIASTASAAQDGAKEKCYGVAKAAQNDCAANGHSCQGMAKTDNDPAEWKYVPKGECETAGGKTSAPGSAK
ncbi:MAG: DUF2282 domain-containing protein [Gammaproteobacteria bacterium]|nr:DUF2282 domain-containing protein [Gammaproteobacteria bacterium]